MSNPTLYRGTVYPTQRAAAKAAGVCKKTVHNHLTWHGHLDFIGRNNPATSKAAEALGRSWASQTALALYLGAKRQSVSRWIRDGRHDLIERADKRRAKREAPE